MGRALRKAVGGVFYHVINRGNQRQTLFHKEGDFDAFQQLLIEACQLVPVRVLSFCLMPNHWHLVLWPLRDGELSKFMAWLTNTHVKRYRQHYHDPGAGHLYQGRFKSFPVQDDRHFLTLCRYVEANPLRANLVQQPADWRWSSFRLRKDGDEEKLLTAWPLERPANWEQLVLERIEHNELGQLRHSVSRGTPFGHEQWSKGMAAALGLAATLRKRGRPRKLQKNGG
jgi:REP-associated tyrosine transposase